MITGSFLQDYLQNSNVIRIIEKMCVTMCYISLIILQGQTHSIIITGWLSEIDLLFFDFFLLGVVTAIGICVRWPPNSEPKKSPSPVKEKFQQPQKVQWQRAAKAVRILCIDGVQSVQVLLN